MMDTDTISLLFSLGPPTCTLCCFCSFPFFGMFFIWKLFTKPPRIVQNARYKEADEADYKYDRRVEEENYYRLLEDERREEKQEEERQRREEQEANNPWSGVGGDIIDTLFGTKKFDEDEEEDW